MEEKQKTIALSDYLVKKAMIASLETKEADTVLEEMVAALAKAGRVPQGEVKSLVKTLITREKQGSTGIGGGCAIPHCALEGLEELNMMIARSEEGVDFACVTGEKVRVFILVIYPPNQDQLRRTVLGRVLHLCRNTNWLKFLKAAKTAREISELVAEYDAQP